MSYFQTIKEKWNNMSFNLEQNQIHTDENDMLAEKTLFAFLADILKCFKKDKNYDLMKELKENENLTKEKLNEMFKKELENNKFLSKEEKELTNKLLNKDNDFYTKLVGNKFREINDFREKNKNLLDDKKMKDKIDNIKFQARDVFQASKDLKSNTKKEVAEKTIKQVAKLLLKK